MCFGKSVVFKITAKWNIGIVNFKGEAFRQSCEKYLMNNMQQYAKTVADLILYLQSYECVSLSNCLKNYYIQYSIISLKMFVFSNEILSSY